MTAYSVLHLQTIKTLLKADSRSISAVWGAKDLADLSLSVRVSALITDLFASRRPSIQSCTVWPGCHVMLRSTSVSDCDLLQQTHIWLLIVSSYCDTKPVRSTDLRDETHEEPIMSSSFPSWLHLSCWSQSRSWSGANTQNNQINGLIPVLMKAVMKQICGLFSAVWPEETLAFRLTFALQMQQRLN